MNTPPIVVKDTPDENENLHEDPLTGEAGSHPVGAGVGATGGALTGAAIGALGGPAGSALGAIAGGIAGGLMGREVAESLDDSDGVQAVAPGAWEQYWLANYQQEPYFDAAYSFEEYLPAYRLGYETHSWQRGTLFEDIDRTLKTRWDETDGTSTLPWPIVAEALKASWKVLDEKGETAFA